MPVRSDIAGGRSDAESIASSLSVPDAFRSVFDRHFDAVHRYLARRVGRARADDLASQTFVVAFERRASFRSDAFDARPWLLGIATHLLMNDRRSEKRSLNLVARLTARAEPALSFTGYELRELDDDVATALAGLDSDMRDVLLLVAWGELSYEEVAEALGIPVGTVRSRLSRARAHVRAHLGGATAVDPASPDAQPQSEEIT
jgi:RNA polymerase sigma factor (sigma-70 family)